MAGQSAGTPMSSSIKPTGWIRSNSGSKSASTVGVLGDRTNLPSSSRTAPSRLLSKTPVAKRANSRTATSGITSAKQAGKQQKLSTFFAPNTAPPAASAGPTVDSALYHHSPSVERAQRSISGKSSTKTRPPELAGLEDQELEARASSLLKGRFGSVSRSLTASRATTPVLPHLSPLRSDPEPPPRPPQGRIDPPSIRTITPPRRRPEPGTIRVDEQDQQQQSSSPPFEPTLMQETLSNFTPPAWEKAKSSKMALFQRLAGVPKGEIIEQEMRKMAEELEQAHRRMQATSPIRPVRKGGATRKTALQSKGGSGSNSERDVPEDAVVEGPSSTRPKALLRSPRTNRRIYALETQLPGERAVSLQPTRTDWGEVEGAQRRAVSEIRCQASTSILPEAAINGEMTEEESETLPLAWPVEEGGLASDPTCGEGEETQLLPWNDEQPRSICTILPQSLNAVAQVPPSDDEDLLLEPVVLSSSSSPSPSRPTSPSPFSPTAKKRRRIEVSPTLVRSNRRLPKVSPITLTPSAEAAGCGDQFDRVVSALRKEERRQHNGMQLSLNTFLASSSSKRDTTEEEREVRRSGLSEDLEDVLSDDEQEEEVGDSTVEQNGSDLRQEEEEETQPLAWDSSPTRPTPQPFQPQPEGWPASSPTTQRTALSTTSTASTSTGSSSAISLPSEHELDEAGNTQLLSFFAQL